MRKKWKLRVKTERTTMYYVYAYDFERKGLMRRQFIEIDTDNQEENTELACISVTLGNYILSANFKRLKQSKVMINEH